MQNWKTELLFLLLYQIRQMTNNPYRTKPGLQIAGPVQTVDKGTVALTIFLVNRQSLSHGIENSQPLSISAQEQIMIFGQHKTEALFPASEF